jgi:hypothetical protein
MQWRLMGKFMLYNFWCAKKPKIKMFLWITLLVFGTTIFIPYTSFPEKHWLFRKFFLVFGWPVFLLVEWFDYKKSK